VPSAVIADAIAAEHAWRILGRFFRSTVYREIEARAEDGGVTVTRGSLALATKLRRDPGTLAVWAHETVGWTVFLQEIWGRPAWPRERFFDTNVPSEPAMTLRAADWIACDVSAELPEVVEVEHVSAVLSVGGAAIGVIEIDPVGGSVSAERLRAAFTRAGGMELCRAAVREAVIGRPFTAEPSTLRERLAIANAGKAVGGAAVKPMSRRALSRWELSMPAELVGGWPNPMVAAPTPLRAGVLLSRRPNGAVGTSASRRATLPSRAAGVLRESAVAAGELVLRERRRKSARVARVPDLVWRPGQTRLQAFAEGVRSMVAPRRPTPKPAMPAPLPVGPAERLPILMYHRIAPEGAATTARWRLEPDMFEQQLQRAARGRVLQRGPGRVAPGRMATPRPPGPAGASHVRRRLHGFRDLCVAAARALRLYGRAVRRRRSHRGHGRLGRDAAGSAAIAGLARDPAARGEGVIIGSHSSTHPELTGLDPAAAVDEMARSRAILSRGLGTPVDTIAYPHGAQDAIVRHLAGACGYTFGFTCEPGISRFDDGLLALPRIEVRGDMTLDEFRAALAIDAAAEPAHE
jgi:hypothetical protein